MVEPEVEQKEESDPQRHEGARHSRPSGIRKLFGRMGLPSGKREKIFTLILLAIALVWAVVWVTNRDYPFWPGLAGVITIPLLLSALMIDNLIHEE